MGPEKRLRGGIAVLDVDTEELDAARPEVAIDRLEPTGLAGARSAPAAPEVDDDDVASPPGQIERRPVQQVARDPGDC